MPEDAQDTTEAVLAELDTWRARAEAAEKRLELALKHGDGTPRYGLYWQSQPDPKTVKEVLTQIPTLSVEPQMAVENDPSSILKHLIIQGDNMHALIALHASHKSRVDVIYIDPPYNTGNNDFKYKDRFVKKDDPDRHSTWLTFMRDRLRLAKPLLSSRGIIAISIDQVEHATLRLLCDQIFGERNFFGELIWQKKYGGGNDSATFVTEHEYLLVYGAPGASRPLLVPHTDDYLKRYREQDERGRFFWDTLARPGLTGAVRVVLDDGNGPVEVMCGVSQRGADEMLAGGDIRIVRKADGTASVQFKQRLSSGGKRLRSIIQRGTTGVGGTSDGKKDLVSLLGANDFSYPKPVGLLEYVLRAFAPKGDEIILDFFAGSGTTGQAVAQLNADDAGLRQCILVTNNENGICRDVTQPRMKAALSGKWADGNERESLPGSLAFYEIALVEKSDNRDITRARLAENIAGILALRENAHTVAAQEGPLTRLESPEKVVLAWTDLFDTFLMEDAFREFRDSGEAGDREVVVYAASWDATGGQVLESLVEEFPDWRFEPIPDLILEELEKAQRGILKRL